MLDLTCDSRYIIKSAWLGICMAGYYMGVSMRYIYMCPWISHMGLGMSTPGVNPWILEGGQDPQKGRSVGISKLPSKKYSEEGFKPPNPPRSATVHQYVPGYVILLWVWLCVHGHVIPEHEYQCHITAFWSHNDVDITAFWLTNNVSQ